MTPPPSMFRLDGRVAMVTGAGQGIGAGVAAVLAGQGARVAVNDVVPERAEAAARAVDGVAAAFDVTDLDAVRAGVASVAERLGPVDILVANAGIPARMVMAPFRDLEPSDWRPVVDLNLFGLLNCVKATVDGMCERGWGRVIAISSAAGQMGLASGLSLYGAGKGGAAAFIRHLAVEVARSGVTANTLSLGLMATRSGSPAPADSARRVPAGRLGPADDVGAAVVWLAAEGAWVTGQTIGINGGAPTS